MISRANQSLSSLDLWNPLFLKTAIFAAALILSIVLSRFSVWIANRAGLIDIPNRQPHKIHTSPTPIAGGISILLSLLGLLILHNQLLSFITIDLYILAAILILFVIGLIDDLFILSVRYKLLAQLAASVILVVGNYQVHVVNSQVLNTLITIIWFVGIINAFNFIDSNDGLLLGIGIIISAFIIIATINSNQNALNSLTIAFLGILIGLYFYNRFPARLFLGDSGSQIIGVIFALMALRYNPLGFDRTTSWISPILMMAFPIFDVSLVVFSRFRKKLPVFHGGLDHTYHRLNRISNHKRIPNLVIFGATVATNILALVNLYLKPVFSYTLFGSMILLGVILFFKLEEQENLAAS
jgi:UDP-GlcNAc:undecaprenyl-phosphate GlcNAc-1-phosphate transferase